MKINENSRISVPWPAVSQKLAAPRVLQEGRDGVSLEGLAQARELVRRLPDPGSDEVDPERVAAAAARMKDGVYSVSVEEVADAILDDLSTVMAWLSDHTASQE